MRLDLTVSLIVMQKDKWGTFFAVIYLKLDLTVGLIVMQKDKRGTFFAIIYLRLDLTVGLIVMQTDKWRKMEASCELNGDRYRGR